ncbi:2-methylene-furan-3-one reductase isoform X2 [Cryptomeria japonica]|uniref:2-methylene-furan-3-one reductase isoform X2 n=1 Tax=Cryptomeria japonica TaxID=3369 RepID=UPI0025AD5A31|nr:2-methylene-furan-3-one reductase isoform X2 [Cryptomeria japonica]
MRKMQKAWFYNEYGSLDVLQFGDFPVPKPGPGQILVKVRAAALNPMDIKRRKGLFRNNDSDFPAVPGCDMCGVVEEVGEGVSKFKKGDEVYSDIQYFTSEKPKDCGTLAQYTVVEEDLAAHKPKNLSFEEAASLPLALLTAQQAFDEVNFQKGWSVFIVGGAGGVGSLAIQLAKHVYGASRIVSTCSTGKVEFVKSLGADLAVDYTKQSYDQVDEKFDFVLDTIASNLERLREYIESGKLRAVIDPKSPYAFSEVLEAFKHQESGRARGKIVISPIE